MFLVLWWKCCLVCRWFHLHFRGCVTETFNSTICNFWPSSGLFLSFCEFGFISAILSGWWFAVYPWLQVILWERKSLHYITLWHQNSPAFFTKNKSLSHYHKSTAQFTHYRSRTGPFLNLQTWRKHSLTNCIISHVLS